MHLFDLPGEIRNRIYEFVLTTDDTVRRNSNRLRLVNKQLHRETQDLEFQYNTAVVFDSPAEIYGFIARFGGPSSTSQRREYLRGLRMFCVVVAETQTPNQRVSASTILHKLHDHISNIKHCISAYPNISIMYIMCDWKDYYGIGMEYYGHCLKHFLLSSGSPNMDDDRSPEILNRKISNALHYADLVHFGYHRDEDFRLVEDFKTPSCSGPAIEVFPAISECFLLPNNAMAVAMLPIKKRSWAEYGVKVRDPEMEC